MIRDILMAVRSTKWAVTTKAPVRREEHDASLGKSYKCRDHVMMPQASKRNLCRCHRNRHFCVQRK
ncbi:hypothetical protein E2C01_039697 [Portunus trituberculatus]|uniref:Uncharacterized protein n=1 Tax=Portunus trituberculatus TaxID=210409 RepID=A0A5B7FFE6_PORTR|nr:hypothetical protein [Portunus trituberculatus]